MNIIEKWQGFAPRLQSVLRIMAGFTFTLHGMMKLFMFPAPLYPGAGPVHLFSELGLAGILETFGGLSLLLGFWTRPIAFLLSGEMAVAFFQVHVPRNLWPVLSGGELAYLYCFIWLYLSMAGAGPWSIDAIIKKRRGPKHQEAAS